LRERVRVRLDVRTVYPLTPALSLLGEREYDSRRFEAQLRYCPVPRQ
jgi:hypothetical protein